jgi:hypothetical protein
MYGDVMSELSTIVQSLQELQRMHQLNLELLEQLGIVCEWILANNIPVPNREKFNSLLRKTHALAQELYLSSPKTIQYRKISDESLQGDKSDKEFTEPRSL